MQVLLFHILLFLFIPSGKTSEIPEHFERRIEKTLKPIFKSTNYAYQVLDSMETAMVYELEVDSTFEGYLAIASSKGRFERFKYMILYSPEVVVQKIKVIEYHSTRGTEVASKKWLKQFEGNRGEKLKYGKDINAISGATYSASSMTNDIPIVTQWVMSVINP